MPGCVLITGASAGFGKACAEKFAREGWRLVLAARRVERLRELQQRLGQEVPVHILELDVRDRAAVGRIPAELPAEFQNIDVLVNNAGLALGLEPAYATKLSDWDTMVDTNIKGLIYCTRTILPGMVARQKGHIVNIGSIAGSWPYPGGNVYGATKAFVRQFSRNLRADLNGTGIRVTNIEPGMAESEFSIVRFEGDAAKAKKIYENCEPLRPEDMAEIVFWSVNVPAHVNINSIEVMPTCQTWGGLTVHRHGKIDAKKGKSQ